MLETGIKGIAEVMAGENNCARTMGSGALDVFATPAMVALLEEAAWKSVQSHLEEGQGTVGTLMNVQHLAATPLGMKVTAETELTSVEGRKLVFTVKAYDEVGLIGEGTHERFIVVNDKFMSRTNAKLG